MKPLEYVASGTSHTKIVTLAARESYSIELINGIFKKLEVNNHKFSILYNAYTEKRFGNIFESYRPSIYKVHADSGGLQIITQGHKTSDKIKNQVYEVQGKWSDVAMSFDEIPLILEGKTSNRNAHLGRYFDKENLEQYARLSGKNLKEQIEAFVNLKTNCKPLLIAHGNCYDTYMKWADYIYDEIPQELHKYIGGIAIGGAALGPGYLEDIKKSFYASQIRNDANYIHILGVGSVKRLMPYLTFEQNGLYKDVTLSYDSTTHTAGGTTSHYFNEAGKLIQPGRHMGPIYIEAYEVANRIFDLESIGVDLNYFYENMAYNNYEQVKDKDGNFIPEIVVKYLAVTLCYIGASIYNFTKEVDKARQNKKELISISKKNGIENSIQNLYNVKDIKDFNYWLKHCGAYVESKPVREKPMSLEGLF